MNRTFPPRPAFWAALFAVALPGCLADRVTLPPGDRPNVAPKEGVSAKESVALDASKIPPMFRELVPIDLPTAARVAAARNLDIQYARERVEASRGKLQSSVGAAFPAFAPTALFEGVDGTVRATQGNLVGVGFHTFQPYMAIQWLLNPGKVIYDIVAARKRLLASKYQERHAVLETLRIAAAQYYDLALAQARVGAVHQALAEAQEFSRIAQNRAKAGAGLAADELRAQAEVAGRQQDLVLALKSFYDASVALALTLHLDATVTLVPSGENLPQTTLVREDLGIEDLLALAVEHRDDLHAVRQLIKAAAADRKATWWGGLGPSTSIGYQYGGISGRALNVDAPPQDRDYGMSEQQRVTASASWKLGLVVFGELKTSRAAEKQAFIEADRKLDWVKAQVVRAVQDTKAQNEVIGRARQQVQSADEALRLSHANLKAGTMTALDVLHSESIAASARLRYSEAVVRYNQAQLNLLAGLGLLDEQHLFCP